jgi:hypothetical protein
VNTLVCWLLRWFAGGLSKTVTQLVGVPLKTVSQCLLGICLTFQLVSEFISYYFYLPVK